MKKWLLIASFCLPFFSVFSLADVTQRLNIKTTDGSVSNWPYQLKVTTGTLTDNNDGTMTLQTGGGGGGGGSTVLQSSGVAFGSATNTVTQDTHTFVFNDTTFNLHIGTNPYSSGYTDLAPGFTIWNSQAGQVSAGVRVWDLQATQTEPIISVLDPTLGNVPYNHEFTIFHELSGGNDLVIFGTGAGSGGAGTFKFGGEGGQNYVTMDNTGLNVTTGINASSYTFRNLSASQFIQTNGSKNASSYDLFNASPTYNGQANWTSASPSTFTTLAVSGLTSGQCVQTGTGGILTVTGSACGSGGGGGGASGQINNANQFSAPYYSVAGSSNVLSAFPGVTFSTNTGVTISTLTVAGPVQSTVSYGLSVGSLTVTGSSAGQVNLTEGLLAGVSGVAASHDVFWADSGSHTISCNFNNSASTFSLISSSFTPVANQYLYWVSGGPNNWVVGSTAPAGSGGGGTPATPFNSVQYNNAGAFGGSGNFTWNGTSMTVIMSSSSFRSTSAATDNSSGSPWLDYDLKGTQAGDGEYIADWGSDTAGGQFIIENGTLVYSRYGFFSGRNSMTIDTAASPNAIAEYNNGTNIIDIGSTAGKINLQTTTGGTAGSGNPIVLSPGGVQAVSVSTYGITISTQETHTSSVTINSGLSIYQSTNSVNSLYIATSTVGGNSVAISTTGEFVLAGSTGTSGQALTSQGPGVAAKWTTIAGGSGIVSPGTFTWVNNFGIQGSTLSLINATGPTTLVVSTSATGISQLAVSSTIAVLPTDPILSISSASGTTILWIDNAGNLISSGTTPTVSSCGTSPSVIGNNISGQITIGGGVVTACTLTFANGGFVNAPICIPSDNSATVAVSNGASSATSQVFNLSATLGGGLINYICIGFQK